MPYLTGVASVQDYGAVGNGTTDDTTAINDALSTVFNTYGGGVVVLPWTEGGYLVSGTVSIPPYVELQGQTNMSLNLPTALTDISRIVVSSSWAPSFSTGIVSFLSKTPGGWSVNAAGSALKRVVIDGTGNTNSNLQGINFIGPVYDTHLEDVFVYKAPHNSVTASGETEAGIAPTYPYHQRWTRVNSNSAGNFGFNVTNFTDSTFDNCLVFGSNSTNYVINNNSNSVFTACRAEWSTTSAGFAVSGSSGSIVFNGCTTDQNAEDGYYISSATGQTVQGGGIIITGGKVHADGWAGTSGRNNGINISSSTVPVVITGVNVESGQNPNNSNYYPADAISISNSPNVTVTGCMLQGITTAWNDNNGTGNTNLVRTGCIGVTGNPSSQTFSILSNYPAQNAPQPADQNLISWAFDQAAANTTTTPSVGVIRLSRLEIHQTTTVTNVLASIPSTAGTSLTSNENFAGLYGPTGTLLSSTADQTSSWASTGLKTMALTTAQTVTPGAYYVAIVVNGTGTVPGFLAGTVLSAGTLNAGTTSATPRFATSGTSVTTLPGSITLTSAATSGASLWVAVS